MKRLLNVLANAPHTLANLYSFRARCKAPKSDLQKGITNAKPISNEQRIRIKDYWAAYLIDWKSKYAFDIRWYDIYNRTNVFGFDLEAYIPDSFYYAIVDRCLTNALNANVMDDKNLYDLYFYDVNQPDTIVRKIKGVYMNNRYKIISEREAVERCAANHSVIIKPSINALAGQGIMFWNERNNTREELQKALSNADSIIAQDLIKQHQFLANFTDSCVNTMRIVTLLWEGEVHVTTAVLIMGGPTAKTNHLHGGGIVCGILPDGQLRDTAFDGNLNEYKEHPNGLVFADVKIPNYDKCVALVKELAPRLSGVAKLLNWDITLDQDGEPMLIEVNITWGGSVQIAGGPALGDKTKEVLDYVTKHDVWK